MKNTNKLSALSARLTGMGLSALSLGTVTLGLASHAHAETFYDHAKVISATPIYETVSVREPYEKCHIEDRVIRHSRQQHSSATPTILGALIGGAIGNELGHNKSNKRVGAVAGAILGGSIAKDLTSKTQPTHVTTKKERVCYTAYNVNHYEEITGYDVSYRYRGNQYSTITAADPGKLLRVAVDVSPVDY